MIPTDKSKAQGRFFEAKVSRLILFGQSDQVKTDINQTAMKFYNLTGDEMDTLPYWGFENKNSPIHPGRSYALGGVQRVVYRKLATLTGLHEKVLNENQLLKRGCILFEQKSVHSLYAEYSIIQDAKSMTADIFHIQKHRREKNPQIPSEPNTIEIVKPEIRFDPYSEDIDDVPEPVCWGVDIDDVIGWNDF